MTLDIFGRTPPRRLAPSRPRARGWALAAAALTVVTFGASAGVPRASASDGLDAEPSATPAPSRGPADCEWIGTWGTALVPASLFDTGRSLSGFEDESIRMIVKTSIGGDHVRLRFSNAYGLGDLTIGHASVARPATPPAPDLDPRTLKELSFGGRRSVVVPAGGEVLSDPMPIGLPPLSQLAVTIYLPRATGPTTWHWIGRQTAFVANGDQVTQPIGAGFTSTGEHFYFLADVEVTDDRRADGAVVVLGDSISDGFGTPVDTNQRWPDALAQRHRVQEHVPQQRRGRNARHRVRDLRPAVVVDERAPDRPPRQVQRRDRRSEQHEAEREPSAGLAPRHRPLGGDEHDRSHDEPHEISCRAVDQNWPEFRRPRVAHRIEVDRCTLDQRQQQPARQARCPEPRRADQAH